MKNKLLPQKLKELRKVNNYTQDYVAEVLGVVRQTYSHYETGKRTPDAEAFYKLAGLYNISVDDLLHLTIDIDREESYDAPAPTQASTDFLNFLMILLIRKNICLTQIWNGNYFSILIKYLMKTKKKL